MPNRNSLIELAGVFLRLGTLAFGGPAAHIAMFREEVVRRRRWLSEEEFLDLLGAVNLIPGPNSTELVIHLGLRRAGWRGLVLGGLCFILPAAVLSGVLAWLYMRLGRLPEVEAVLYGVKPVIIAVVFRAVWGLARTALKDRMLVALALSAAVINVLGVHELLVLAAGGLVACSVHLARTGVRNTVLALPVLPLLTVAPAAAANIGLWPLFLFFFKVGAILFGSGYVLVAFLQADLVERWGWINETQLLDAVTVGQVTPGPLLSTATFIGFLVAGAPGASVATFAIFLPSFIYVALSGPLLPRLRRSPWAGAALDGVNVAAVALMAVVTLHLGRAAVVDATTALIGVAAAVLMLWKGLSPSWLIPAGAAAGWLLQAC